MFTIMRGTDEESKYMFVCKKQIEIKDEILRLNSKEKMDAITLDSLWTYYEETEYNEAARAEHREFLNQIEG
jgi:hypothetical protein